MSREDRPDNGTAEGAVVASLFHALSIRLMGPDRAEWIEAFRKFMRKENPWTLPVVPPPEEELTLEQKVRKVWKTIRIGGRSWKDLSEELDAMGVEVASSVRKAMETHEMIKEPTDVDLVLLHIWDVVELGLHLGRPGAPAEIAGLTVCPLEVGPYLRLDPTVWEELDVVCDGVYGVDMKLETSERVKRLGLDGPDERCKVDSPKAVFVRPRKPAA